MEKEFQGGSTKTVQLVKPYTPLVPEFETNEGSEIVVSIGDQRIKLKENERKEVFLDDIEVEIRPRPRDFEEEMAPSREDPDVKVKSTNPIKPDPETITTKPILSIKSYGNVEIFGGADTSVIPLNTENPYGRALIEATPETTIERTENDQLVIPKGGE